MRFRQGTPNRLNHSHLRARVHLRPRRWLSVQNRSRSPVQTRFAVQHWPSTSTAVAASPGMKPLELSCRQQALGLHKLRKSRSNEKAIGPGNENILKSFQYKSVFGACFSAAATPTLPWGIMSGLSMKGGLQFLLGFILRFGCQDPASVPVDLLPRGKGGSAPY